MPTEQVNKSSVKVSIKSAWLSKINWTQFLAMVAVVLAYFGIDLDAETQAAVLAAIAGAQAAVTWMLKTFFTPTVTQSSIDMAK